MIGDDRYSLPRLEVAESLGMTQVAVNDDKAFKSALEGSVRPLNGVVEVRGVRAQNFASLGGGELRDLVAFTEHDRVSRRTIGNHVRRELLRQFGDRRSVVDAKPFLGEVKAFQRNDVRVGGHEKACYVKDPSVLLRCVDVAIGLARPRTRVVGPRRDRRRH